ncbi:hypothetical protein H4R34_005020, partial [Dimargaris verticillata]
KIQKGQLRLASIDESGSFTTKYWRHWGCVTSTILAKIPAAGSIVGFEKLTPEDQQQVEEAVHSQRPPSASGTAEPIPNGAAPPLPAAEKPPTTTHADTKATAKKSRKRKPATAQDDKAHTVDKKPKDPEEVTVPKKSRASAPTKRKSKTTSRRVSTNKEG